MIKFLTVCFILFTISVTATTPVADPQGLAPLRKNLLELQKLLRENRIRFSPRFVNWGELVRFREKVYFVTAHDPTGTIIPNTPQELRSDELTKELKAAWLDLDRSRERLGVAESDEAWRALKTHVHEMLFLRERYLYNQSRRFLKSGEISASLSAAEALFSNAWLASVRNPVLDVADPLLAQLAGDLNLLTKTVERELHSSRAPASSEATLKEFAPEVGLGALLLLATGFFTGFLLGRRTKRSLLLPERAPVTAPPEVQASDFAEPVPSTDGISPLASSFDYGPWVEEFESLLSENRKVREALSGKYRRMDLCLNHLRESRVGLMMVSDYAGFEREVRKLNQAAPELEEFLAHLRELHDADPASAIVRHVIALCAALEEGHRFGSQHSFAEVSRVA